MDAPAANGRFLLVLAMLCASALLFVQTGSRWSGEIRISSVRIAFSLQSDTVRFRTFVSGNGHSSGDTQL